MLDAAMMIFMPVCKQKLFPEWSTLNRMQRSLKILIGKCLTSRKKMEIFLYFISDSCYQTDIAGMLHLCKTIDFVMDWIRLLKSHNWIHFPCTQAEDNNATILWHRCFRFPITVRFHTYRNLEATIILRWVHWTKKSSS